MNAPWHAGRTAEIVIEIARSRRQRERFDAGAFGARG
jgi:hypothetical protein